MNRREILEGIVRLPLLSPLVAMVLPQKKPLKQFTTIVMFSRINDPEAGMAAKVTYNIGVDGMTPAELAREIRKVTPTVYAFVLPDGRIYNILTDDYRHGPQFKNLDEALSWYDNLHTEDSISVSLSTPQTYKRVNVFWKGRERSVCIPVGPTIAFIEKPKYAIIGPLPSHINAATLAGRQSLDYDYASLPVGFTPGEIESIADYTGKIYYDSSRGKKPVFVTL